MFPELKVELEKLKSGERFRSLEPSGWVNDTEFKRGGKRYLDYTRSDFLACASQKSVKRAIQQVIESGDLGIASSRLLSGTQDIHSSCEQSIAGFLGLESALLFSSKNQALLSLIANFLRESDFLFGEELSSLPLADAAHLVNANYRSFSAAKLEDLKTELERTPALSRKIVFMESINHLTGELHTLKPLIELCQKHHAAVLIDESLALAILGLRGAGALEHEGIHKPSCSVIVDCGEALGLGGAFIAGSSLTCEYLLQWSRTFRTETSSPPMLARGIEASLHYLELETARRQKLFESVRILREGLAELGFPELLLSTTPVLCLKFGKFRHAKELEDALEKKGILTEALPLELPREERAILRLKVRAPHSLLQIKETLSAFSDILPRLKKS